VIAVLVLAAGRSSRTAPAHKLLANGRGGESLIACTVGHVVASVAESVWVVVGHQADAVKRALAGLGGLNFVEDSDYEQGLSASLRTGLAALPDRVEGVMVCLGDMPFVTTATIDRLIAAFMPGQIVVPVYCGRRGNPVLWDRCFIAELRQVTGDRGGRGLQARHADLLIEVAVDDDGVVRDCDTVAALQDWRR